MTTRKQDIIPMASQDSSIGLPIAAVLLFAVILSLGALGAGAEDIRPEAERTVATSD